MALVDDGSQPLVSVIIASYNHEKYIEASIASVAAQTYRNVELLVVDDGSSDGSVELLRGLQAKYGFDLRVQQNQGLSRTLNEAIARARGNLIVPFGSDDIMLPQRLEKQVAHMRYLRGQYRDHRLQWPGHAGKGAAQTRPAFPPSRLR